MRSGRRASGGRIDRQESFAALSPRQRNLLRQHLLDGLTVDELCAIYQVHRVTAARWLTAGRSDLWSHAISDEVA